MKKPICPADELIDVDTAGYAEDPEDLSCETEVFDLDGKKVDSWQQ